MKLLIKTFAALFFFTCLALAAMACGRGFAQWQTIRTHADVAKSVVPGHTVYLEDMDQGLRF